MNTNVKETLLEQIARRAEIQAIERRSRPIQPEQIQMPETVNRNVYTAQPIRSSRKPAKRKRNKIDLSLMSREEIMKMLKEKYR